MPRLTMLKSYNLEIMFIIWLRKSIRAKDKSYCLIYPAKQPYSKIPGLCCKINYNGISPPFPPVTEENNEQLNEGWMDRLERSVNDSGR